MEDFKMKTPRLLAVTLAVATSIPLMAQQVSAPGSQKEVYTTQGPMGFGDASASHSWEMSSVTGELEGKLDSRTAKVGDRVVLKTTEKVQTADGTVIPRGTRLAGRITEVQTRDSAHAVSQMGIAFDRAEMKNGQSIAIYTLIRGVNPPPNFSDVNPLANADPTATVGSTANGSPTTGGGRGGRNGGGQPDIYSDAIRRTSPTTTSVGDRANATMDPNPLGTVQLAGHGDLNPNVGAHQLAAARAVPHATAIPGVMLAGNSSASGVFLATMKDIQFDSGTQMQLGIVADQ
jgi:hypothetical protein